MPLSNRDREDIKRIVKEALREIRDEDRQTAELQATYTHTLNCEGLNFGPGYQRGKTDGRTRKV